MWIGATRFIRSMSVDSSGLATTAVEFMHRTCDVWPASSGTVLEQAYRKAMAERATVSLEYYYEGNTRDAWSLIEAHPVSEGVAVFARDITEQKRTAEQLRQSEARLQAAVDLVKLGRYAWNPQTMSCKWDDTLRAMWGLPAGAPVDYDVWRACVPTLCSKGTYPSFSRPVTIRRSFRNGTAMSRCARNRWIC